MGFLIRTIRICFQGCEIGRSNLDWCAWEGLRLRCHPEESSGQSYCSFMCFFSFVVLICGEVILLKLGFWNDWSLGFCNVCWTNFCIRLAWPICFYYLEIGNKWVIIYREHIVLEIGFWHNWSDWNWIVKCVQDKLLDQTSVTHLFPITKYLGLLATGITGYYLIFLALFPSKSIILKHEYWKV